MRKYWSALFLMLFIGLGSYAQPMGGRGMRPEARERIHAAKMVYITDRLHLPSAQSSDFMPVYGEYETELRTLRQTYFKKYKGIDPADADAATSRQFIDDNLDYQQDVIVLKRKYNDKFLKVITSQQLVDLYKAEREFREMLQKRLKERMKDRRD